MIEEMVELSSRKRKSKKQVPTPGKSTPEKRVFL